MNNPTLKDANILIVDDQQANIDILEGLLEFQGFTNIKTVTDPREVVPLFKSFDPDLILLDLTMPHLTGFEVMQQLKALVPEETFMPILVLTADISIETKQQALAGGASDFLSKPFDLVEVGLRIRNLLYTSYLVNQLENQNAILEEKVKERTINLEKANKELDKANKELSVLDQAKLDFLQLISHEIRTPLNGILGFTDLLRSEIQSAELQEYLDYLESSAKRLETFSYKALKITELRTKKFNLKIEQVSLNDLFNTAHKFLLDKIEASNINIIFQKDESFDELVCDWDLVKICFECIIDNAVKYSPPGGDVIVKTSMLGEAIVCEFFDSGSGFSENALENLFRLFGLGDEHIDQNTGLNLALVKLIMEVHNGEIEIINNLPKGSIVRLIFNARTP